LKHSFVPFTAAAALLLAGSHAQAAQLKVFVSGAMAHALQQVSEDYAKKNGHTLDFVVGTTGVIQDKVRAGDKADVVEVTAAGMDALEKEKLVVPGTRIDLARALIGIGVRDGQPVPDISTVDALKARLVAAKSIAWIDPKIGGQAGAAIISLLKKMGITDDVMKKSVFGKTGGEAVQKMAAGQADIAISFISEIKPIKGAKVVGPLPEALQSPSTYAGAVGINSANPELARALLKTMAGPQSRPVMVEAGLEPVSH
jgi:molybdate transport system substrate-binding protein